MNVPALPETRIQIGEASYASSSRSLVREGNEQRLEPRLAQLLDTFCEHPGDVLERETLLERVWGDEGSDEALTQAVSRLRQLLGDRALIQTEPRRGYRLLANPTPVLEEAGRDLSTDPAVNVAGAEASFTARTVKLAFVSGVIIGLMVSAIAALLLWPQSVTVLEVSTQTGDGPEDTRSIRCEGDLDECGGELDIE